MKVVSLDLHAEASQLCVMDENGEVVMEMPVPTGGRAPVTERDLRPIVSERDWGVQRAMWERVQASAF